jgi:hypothetical protein
MMLLGQSGEPMGKSIRPTSLIVDWMETILVGWGIACLGTLGVISGHRRMDRALKAGYRTEKFIDLMDRTFKWLILPSGAAIVTSILIILPYQWDAAYVFVVLFVGGLVLLFIGVVFNEIWDDRDLPGGAGTRIFFWWMYGLGMPGILMVFLGFMIAILLND